MKNKKRKFYYLTKPSCHGNGGWCGDKVLQKGTLKTLLNINPFTKYDYSDYYYNEDGDNRFRICIKPNSNFPCFIYTNEYRWESVNKKYV